MNSSLKTIHLIEQKIIFLIFILSTIITSPLIAQNEDEIKDYTPPVVEEVFQIVESMPEFIGGINKMYIFLYKNYVYPIEAIKKNTIGKAYVRFTVKKDGSIADPVLLRGTTNKCDLELLRVISLMPKWKPGEQRGNKVNVVYTIPFKIRYKYPIVTCSITSDQELTTLANFQGSTEELNNHFNNQLKYKQKLLISEDTVSYQFSISKNGTLNELTLISSTSEDVSNETTGILKSIGKWNPSLKKEKAIKTKKVTLVLYIKK